MDRAPLPPHERPWRHPSELGPPAPEPTSTSGRVLIATSATLSLLLIGLLALSMTPDRGASPVAVEATAVGSSSGLLALDQPELPMVSPLGDDGWGVTTSGAAGTRARTMAARLPSGDVVDVEVVRRDAESGVTLVSLPEETHGYRLARHSPAPTDMVVVQGEHRSVVAMADVDQLDVAEGAPVLDEDGALVGICTTGDDGVDVMTVSTMPDAPAAPSTTAPRSTTTVATSTPSTSTVPSTSTSVPATTVPATPATLPATASTAAALGTAPDRGALSDAGAAATAPG